ncbi:hypothetical protein CCR94_02295 [Rhodoblastus sphagnicola]|uniref:Uncharacterized protein n=1 Tax=Rhodoblastus sphagnicola TaxID=333368 RepID=A0A2S6NF34_9HYPH|nr:helix-turn-helix transcriptional regulator [Rhodoblastus sphagnicola]MBB4200214.1 transcriptional regulator with XRE-family HTH domain [Rhodoblastus sphagnicola]PPQ33252.1 hypothetical protein CCR94_02295 [Rhodoblastus sphagnicola]
MGKKAPDLTDLQHERFDGILTTLAQRVRTLRKAKGMSGRQFAEKVGISHTTVVMIEGGAINISLLIVFLVAEALEVEVNVLLNDLASETTTQADGASELSRSELNITLSDTSQD